MTKRNIVHVEFSSRDFKESGDFYHKLFGWKITPIPEMNYALWEAADASGGGFNPLGHDTNAGDVLVYVDSDDIEGDLKKVKALGGTVLQEKMEIPGQGWFGVFKDLTGNRVALYTTLNPR
ncbi:MAG TPA: VOC family protein [Anaerolineales bacterium]|nr:VOC family protein [Anaerolineales bacterium]